MSEMSDNPFEKFMQHVDKTFKEAADRYMEEIVLEGVKDLTRIKHSIDCVLPYVGNMRLIDIDNEALKQFKHDRRAGVGPFVDHKGRPRPAMVNTVGKDLTQIVTVLNRACRVWRWLPSTPKLLHLSGAQKRGYPLSWEEQDKLFRMMPTGWDVAACVFAINTGVRKEELFGLRWEDEVKIPDLDAFVFVLNRTKNGERRAVIPNSIARRCVEAMRGLNSEWVFPLTKMRCHHGKVWLQAWDRAGMPDDPLLKKGIHNLRHTAAHRLRAAGVSQENRNAILGHARTNLAEHYALPDLKRLFEAVELITVRRDTAILRCQPGAPSTRG
jgi:integrase